MSISWHEFMALYCATCMRYISALHLLFGVYERFPSCIKRGSDTITIRLIRFFLRDRRADAGKGRRFCIVTPCLPPIRRVRKPRAIIRGRSFLRLCDENAFSLFAIGAAHTINSHNETFTFLTFSPFWFLSHNFFRSRSCRNIRGVSSVRGVETLCESGGWYVACGLATGFLNLSASCQSDRKA